MARPSRSTGPWFVSKVAFKGLKFLLTAIFTAATFENVAPAAAVVPTPADKDGAPYFKWETVQLTTEVLANLTNAGFAGIDMFDFTRKANNSSQCRVFPGDANWPSDTAWNNLNLLTGGKLIKTVPLAAPCYQGWPQYNTTLCQDITNSWSDPHLQ